MRDARSARSAGGAALLVSLLLLTALTLLALAAVSDAGLQSRMAGNLDKARRAAANAQAALAWAEMWLLGQDGELPAAACNDECAAGQVIRVPGIYPAAPEHEPMDWWATHGYSAGLDPVSGEALDPVFVTTGGSWIIEEANYEAATGPDPMPLGTGHYRILAAGFAPGTVSVLESVVARPWGDDAWSDPFPGNPGQASFCRAAGVPAPCGRLAWRKRR